MFICFNPSLGVSRTISRIATRVAATVAASAALTVGAAGIASAATASHNVQDNTVSVTFKAGITNPIGGCVAVVAERDDAGTVFERIKNLGNVNNIGDALKGERTTMLKTEGGSPVALPILTRPVTVSAEVPTGVHSLITYCAGDTVPLMRDVATGGAVNPMGSVVSDGPALISSGINFF